MTRQYNSNKERRQSNCLYLLIFLVEIAIYSNFKWKSEFCNKLSCLFFLLIWCISLRLLHFSLWILRIEEYDCFVVVVWVIENAIDGCGFIVTLKTKSWWPIMKARQVKTFKRKRYVFLALLRWPGRAEKNLGNRHCKDIDIYLMYYQNWRVES